MRIIIINKYNNLLLLYNDLKLELENLKIDHNKLKSNFRQVVVRENNAIADANYHKELHINNPDLILKKIKLSKIEKYLRKEKLKKIK